MDLARPDQHRLASAPLPAEVGPELARRINGRILVGHNVGVDWRLLHRRHPAITPAGLMDTPRLARHLKLVGGKNSLSALTDQFGLTPQIERLAAGSQPHRALWVAVAAAMLLPALIARAWSGGHRRRRPRRRRHRPQTTCPGRG